MRFNDYSPREYFILLLLTLFASSQVQGQNYLLNENFSTFPGNTQGWTNNTITGVSGDVWVFNNPGGRALTSPISNPAAIFDSDDYSGGGGAENVALESPAMNATSNSTLRLLFDHRLEGGFGGEGTVEVFDGSTWTSVYSTTATVANSQNIDISSIAGGKNGVKVRFRWEGDWSWYWIVDNVRILALPDYDAMTTGVSLNSTKCGDPNDSIFVNIKNNGAMSISNFAIKASLVGTLGGNAVNSTQNITYSATLASNATTTIAFPPFNSALGGAVSITAWTELSTDQDKANDTAKSGVLDFIGRPAAPSAANASRCGEGSVTLQASNFLSTDSVVWYDDPILSASIGVGANFPTPITGPGNYTYYVGASRGGAGAGTGSLATTSAAGNGQQGAMFDVVSAKDLRFDSVRMSMQTTGTITVAIYYKTGTYFGFETNSGAWTLLGTDVVTNPSNGSAVYANVGNTFIMQSGTTYGIYVQMQSGGTLNYTNGNNTYSNADLTITTGKGVSGTFGGTFNPRTWNGEVFYSQTGCPGPRSAVQVEVKALPDGSGIVKGTPFVGTFNSGSSVDPHVVAHGDSISLEILPPSNTSNANFGVDWYISNVSMETLNGTPVPSADTGTYAPTTILNGSLLFVPSFGVSDSTFHIIATVTSLLTGCDTMIGAYVYVAPRPNASFTFNATCDGSPMVFVNNSTVISGLLAFDWDFAGLGTSQLENPDFLFPASGSYDVILKTTSDYGYTDYDTVTVLVKEVPQTTFDAVNACEGTAIQLTNNTVMPTGTATYTWDFGDGNTDNVQNTSHIYAVPGIYTVSYTVNVNGCETTKKKTVTQAPRAIVNFSSVTSCNNTDVSFTNSSSLLFGTMGYDWSFGDTKTSTSANPKHNYAGFGTFDVTLRANTDLGCVDSFTAQITLLNAPAIAISYSAPCAGESIRFTNNSVVPAGFVNSYDWTFGDGKSSTLSAPTHTYPGVGTYTLFIRSFSTNGCSDTLQTTITINEKPNAGIVLPALVCDGEEVDFLNSTTSAKLAQVFYAWDFGNGQMSMAKDTSFKYSGAASYDVVLIATITGGCADTAMKTIRVSPVPAATFTIASALTKDGTMQFFADETAAGTKYLWFFGDGNKDTIADPQNQYMIDGVYYVRLITKNADACTNEYLDTVRIFRTSLNGSSFGAEVSLYPNPNNGQFIVKLEGASFADMNVNVVNALGQTIGFTSTLSADNAMELNLNNAAKGVYYLHMLNQAGEQTTLRFVVR